MTTSAGRAPGFWVVCEGPEDCRGPLAVDLSGPGRAVAVFSFEEEARLYLRLRDDADGRRAVRVSGDRLLALLSGLWSGFGSVALDPVPDPGADARLPPTTTSRERFVRFLASRGRQGYRTAVAAAR